jgi:hypothetical protein
VFVKCSRCGVGVDIFEIVRFGGKSEVPVNGGRGGGYEEMDISRYCNKEDGNAEGTR